jgi:hypothetical protein
VRLYFKVIEGMQKNRCFLCGSEELLQKSHIIPTFVAKYLKKTSTTGHLRGCVEPNKRIQDTLKLPLLCKEHEILFCKYETWFSKNIFLPYHEQKKRKDDYNEMLLRFVVSLSWRVLIHQFNEYKELNKEIVKAESVWRKFLVGESKNIGKYQHHIFFADYAESADIKNVPKRLQMYLGRSVDATLVHSKDYSRIFIYSKLCKIIIVSFIAPPKNKLWVNTRIKKSGFFKNNQYIKDETFGEFLIGRAEMISNSFEKISTKQTNKINVDFLKNVGRGRTGSLEAILMQKKIEKDKEVN